MSDEIKNIKQRMKEVRRELGDDLAISARDITDWRAYVRASPWLCMGAAAAIGYLIVPKGQSVVRLSDLDLKTILQQSKAAATGSPPPPRLTKKLSRTIISTLGGLAMKSLLSYVGDRFANTKVPPSRHFKSPQEFTDAD